MHEIERLGVRVSWIDLDFVERERTPPEIVEMGIHLHVAGLSLSNTKQILERLGVKRSRTAIHNSRDTLPATALTGGNRVGSHPGASARAPEGSTQPRLPASARPPEQQAASPTMFTDTPPTALTRPLAEVQPAQRLLVPAGRARPTPEVMLDG